MKKTSVFENGLIWFGAAVSLAEILTGTYLAPLGFSKGVAAVIIGHIIGCVLLCFAGFIGGSVRKSSMETVKMSFGDKGSYLFAVLNILQLVGWTAIMIYDGAIAANAVLSVGRWIWALLIGGLIIIWIFVGVKSLGKINIVAMADLFILTLLLCFAILSERAITPVVAGGMSFGAAVELSVAMPLSWLPLISDYTKEAEEPMQATVVSGITYGVVSCWMYVIGMGAAIFAGTSDVVQIMVKAGLGAAGLIIIVFSTVTTTFLDAYSAGVSSETLSQKINAKAVAVIVALTGTVSAAVYPMADITDFLYFIGSVFAPMIAIQITDFFVLKEDSSKRSINLQNICIWLIGFVIYRLLMKFDIVIGSTLPDMIITGLICMAVNKAKAAFNND